ncbi:protein of unknown function (DUF4325) [Actinobacteria bacterium IMCC26207]|nr:protein of unknown function (DUF4325) [Actinobacteria bacterium IMCC26207]
MEWIKPKSQKVDFKVFEQQLLPAMTAAAEIGSVGLDFTGVEFFDITGIVPVIALSDRFAADGVQTDFRLPELDMQVSYWESSGWIAAIEGVQRTIPHAPTYTPLKWFSSGESCNAALEEAMDVLARVSEFPEGVLRGVKWALDEITDNVLVHSGGARGWVQVISRPKRDEVHLAIVDCGHSIVETIREGYPEVGSDNDALRLAVQRGTTRDKKVGQGNGLAGSLRIAAALNGYVTIMSGSACLRQAPGRSPEVHESPRFPGTFVTLTLRTDAEIDVSEALWGVEDGDAYEPSRPFEYSHIQRDGIVFRILDESSGFGNRASGEALVNKLRNIANGSPNESVIIDFEGVDLATASFLDEFLAKLIRREGVTAFFSRYSLRNMNELVRRTADQVIAQRLMTGE